MQRLNEVIINHGVYTLTPEQINNMRSYIKEFQQNLDIAIKDLEICVLNKKSPILTKKTPIPIKQKQKIRATGKTMRTPAKIKSQPKKAEKGQISYPVSGKDGKMMNLADIKKWIDGIYESNTVIKTDQ